MGRGRSYNPIVRQRAFEMAVYEGYDDIEAIAMALKINLNTLKRWKTEDRWIESKEEKSSASFVNIRNNLMVFIHRLSQRLVESIVGLHDDEPLPDENLELRIDRLTRSLERTAPMGTFLLTKQRLDVVGEIQQVCFDALEQKQVTQEDISCAFKILKIYATNVKNSSRKGNAIAA